MTKEVLRREIKFVINSQETWILKKWLVKNKISRTFPSRLVNSIYYDDPKFNDLKSNLTGLAKREKNRLRWYNDEQEIYFEKKIKKNFLSKKYTIKLETERSNLDYSNFFSYHNPDLEKINEVINIKTFLLKPAILILYRRDYFNYKNSINITLDSDLNFTNYDTGLKYKDNNRTILELKYDMKFHSNLNNLIKDFPIVQSRNSKYLLGMANIGRVNYI